MARTTELDRFRSTYGVEGMTCDHCVAAVTDELLALDEVTAVDVRLVAGGTSTVDVTSETQISPDRVAAALAEAGDYRVVPAS